MEGFLLFNKPEGFSCYDIIRFLKKRFNIEKIGHGGSLDVLAQGILVIGITKKYTKKLTYFLKNSEKEYIADLILGFVSETYDREGPLKKVENFFIPKLDEIEKVIKENFIGLVNQKPPIFSAVKIKGIPAYKLARLRKKVNLELKNRKVFIKDIEILKYDFPNLKLRIVTGSGVYIRSLANDIGEKLKCGAYLNNLVRTRINNYILEEALTFDDFNNNIFTLEGEIFGKVQNVGFRFFLKEKANKLNLKGWVKNTKENSVRFLINGDIDKILHFLNFAKKGPLLAEVIDSFFVFKRKIIDFKDFMILK